MFRFNLPRPMQFIGSSIFAVIVLAAVVVFGIVLAYLLTGTDQVEGKSTEKHRGTRVAMELEVNGSGTEDTAKAPVSDQGEADRVAASTTQDAPQLDAQSLADVFRELEQLAYQGDAWAACQLASRLTACRQWARTEQAEAIGSRAWMELFMSTHATLVHDENIDDIAHRFVSIEQHEAQCDAVTSGQLDRAYEFQKLAARSGSDYNRLDLVLSPALPADDFINVVDDWQDYRSRVPGYLNEAMRAGYTEALLELAKMYTPVHTGERPRFGAGPLGVRQPDPFLSALYFHVYHDLLGLPLEPEEMVAYQVASNSLEPSRKTQLRLDAADLRWNNFSGFTGAGPTPQDRSTNELINHRQRYDLISHDQRCNASANWP